MSIMRCLEIAGCTDCTMLEASNGREALALLREHGASVLITDLNMPVMDGEALLKLVKASPRLNSTRVLVISSLANPAKEKELMQLGAVGVVSKPVSPDKIFRALHTFFAEEFPE